MKKKSISLLIAVAMATTMVPSTLAFADETPAVVNAATQESIEEIKEAPASIYTVTYDTHIQKRGWKSYKEVTGDTDDITKFTDSGTSGTVGKALRVEALKVEGSNLPEGASIEYRVHQQTFGWSDVAKDGEVAGVTGKAKRAEAVQITLKGMPGYAIKYQVHVQKKGWMDAVTTENGREVDEAAVAGTTGQALRIEAIRIQIVKTDAEKTAEVAAINAVAKAVYTKTAEDIEAAKEAVAAVKDATVKAEQTAKIEAITVENPDQPEDPEEKPSESTWVESLSAINETTVEVKMKKAATADDKLTFNFDGVDLDAEKVSYEGSTVILTVPEMVDDKEYDVFVKDSEGNEDYKGTVSYNKNEITKLEVITSDLNETIGNDISVSVKLTDEDGKPVSNKSVTLESSGLYNAFEEAITLKATTDAEGIATFTWTRTHETSNMGDEFDIYSDDKPTVRVQGKVTWTLSDKLVSIDTEGLRSEQLSDGSAFEFTVDAKNADGSKYVGDLHLSVDEADKDQKVEDGTYEIQVWNGKEWVDSITTGTNSNGELIRDIGSDSMIYEITEDDNGSKKFRIYTTNSNVKKIAVTAWYDGDNDEEFDATDPRAVTGNKEYVAAKPEIIFTAKDDSSVIATTPIADETTDQKLYTLSVVDQFGKPFKGTVELDDYAAVDQDVTTDVKNVGFTFSISDKQDGKYSALGGSTIDFSIGGDDSNEDSTVDIKLEGTEGGNNITPVAFVDMPDANGKDDAKYIDSDDIFVKVDKVEAQERKVATIDVEPIDTKNPAAGGIYVWKITAKDQFGSECKSGVSKFNIQLKDKDGKDIDEGDVKVLSDLNGDAVDNDGNITIGNFDGNSGTPNYVQNALNITQLPTFIAIKGGEADKEYQVQVWIDYGTVSVDNKYENGEITKTVKVKYDKAVASKGSISSIVAGTEGSTASTVVAADDNSAAYVNFTDKDGITKLTYDLEDQSGQALNLTSESTGIKTTWTLTNNGNVDVIVNDGNKDYTLAKGSTGTYNIISSTNATSQASLTVKSGAATEIEVSVVGEGIEKAATTKLFYTEEIVNNSTLSATNNGTVVALDKEAEWAIINTTVGNVVVEYVTIGKVVVDGNTTTKINDYISIGDMLKVDTTANTITLTNK